MRRTGRGPALAVFLLPLALAGLGGCRLLGLARFAGADKTLRINTGAVVFRGLEENHFRFDVTLELDNQGGGEAHITRLTLETLLNEQVVVASEMTEYTRIGPGESATRVIPVAVAAPRLLPLLARRDCQFVFRGAITFDLGLLGERTLDFSSERKLFSGAPSVRVDDFSLARLEGGRFRLEFKLAQADERRHKLRLERFAGRLILNGRALGEISGRPEDETGRAVAVAVDLDAWQAALVGARLFLGQGLSFRVAGEVEGQSRFFRMVLPVDYELVYPAEPPPEAPGWPTPDPTPDPETPNREPPPGVY